MMEIKISLKDLPKALKQEAARVKRALPIAAMGAAQRLRTYLVYEIDQRKITDQGILKNSIKVEMVNRDSAGRFLSGGGSVRLVVNAPHAGIVELGARPHPVSAEGRLAIARWAMRRLGLDEKDALRASWAIARKIAERGQAPTFVFRDSLPMARVYLDEEMTRVLNSRTA